MKYTTAKIILEIDALAMADAEEVKQYLDKHIDKLKALNKVKS
jgi:hypothetical protein